MKKAALYVRVSTSHQIDKDSLPFQRKELENYSKYILGIDDFVLFEDAGYSAKNTDRPDYQNMMLRIRNKEFSHLLVWKIDRISRNLKDFTEMYDELKDYGVTFISKNEQFDTSTAMGEAMLKIILVFAELERKLTAERVFSIMLSRAEKGLWNGTTVPLGYDWSNETKFPVVNQTEAKIVRYIYDLYEEMQSTTQVAYRLNNESLPTKRGGKWTAKTIGDILRNPFYIGTYRYNFKTAKTRRLKNKDEWVIVENNHEGIIEPPQYERVNSLLSDNRKGCICGQRENYHTHIFSRILSCGKCEGNMVAGLDRARSDGYKPSRYTCSSTKYKDSLTNCSNFISDVILLPFILNYIANFVNLQNRFTAQHSLRDIESILLRGNAFSDVAAIDKAGLEATYHAFVRSFSDESYGSAVDSTTNSINLELDKLQKNKTKYEKALERLEELYLFSEEAMPQKDFLFKKRDLMQQLNRVNEELVAFQKQQAEVSTTANLSFLSNANFFLINKNLDKRYIEYRELLEVVDKEIIKDFIQSVISKITVVDKKVYSITFNNGITHQFAYKPPKEQHIRPQINYLYREYEPTVLSYLEENPSITRRTLEELTGLKRYGAGILLNELLEKGSILKVGNSIATQYVLNQEKSHS